MPTRRTRRCVSSPRGIGLVALILAITAGAAVAGSSRTTREPERIFVTAVSGTVSVTMAGSSTPVQLDSTVALPARIVTGDDGMLSLTQAGTNITIASDSDIEIPAEAADGQLIARLVQRRGNVFYDVAHREAGTLRVETPFLVAVIKGTQFNVAVQDDSSTISLFQGRLEIDTPNGSDSVFINAGQIATRRSTDRSIGVIGMNDVRLEAPRTGNTVARDDAIQPRVFTNDGTRDMPAVATQARIESVSSTTDGGQPSLGNVDLGLAASLGRSRNVGAGNAGVGAGGVPAAIGVNAGLASGGVPTAIGVNAGLGSGAVPAAISVDAGLGSSGVPATVGVNAGLGSSGVPAAIGVNAGLGAGGVPASVGANLNVGGGIPDVSLGTGTTLGGSVTVDVGLGNNGLHLGTGGSTGDNPGLHLGTGNGNPTAPGKSRGKP